MTQKEKMAVNIACGVTKEIMEAQARGENNVMIGFRVSGIVAGLTIAGALTEKEATEFIINLKNQFNF